jgi:hypothetical protein
MEPPFTREQLQNFDLNKIMRGIAIDQTVKHITKFILHAASGSHHHTHLGDWKMVGNKLVIDQKHLTNFFYQKNPFTGHTDTQKPYNDILPDVIETLQKLFPGVEFRLDEIGSYMIVDWS